GGLAESPSTPRWFTIDLGQPYQLTSYIFWQAPDRIYKSGNPRRWEVWGSNDPDTDGGWSKWTKILTCVSVKPSGGPPGTNTPEDVEAARAGETYRFPEEVAAYRYL